MKTNLLWAGALSCALFATTCLTAPAAAQGGPSPPPRQDTQSPTGVSLQSGAFSHEERDLAIGGAEFPVGLKLDRSYLSSLAGVFSAYSGYATQGWTSNLNIRVGNSIVPTPWQQPLPGQESYLTSVSIGSRSVGFTGGSTQPTGGFVGTYEPVNLGGEMLEFIGTDQGSGHFVFTDTDGSVLVFYPQNAPGRAAMAIASWTAPDGTRADFTYDGDGLRSVISNRGFALLFEYGNVPGGRARTKACAVNMATIYVMPTSTCPTGVQTVTYQYSPAGTSATGPILSGATNAVNQATTYGYSSRGHLNCITLPGQSGCQVANSYSLCIAPVDPDAPVQQEPPEMRNHEQVLSQTLITGETYSYSFPAERECPPAEHVATTVTMTLSGPGVAPPDRPTTTVSLQGDGMPESMSDPLGRTTQMAYTGRSDWTFLGGPPSTPAMITRPEGNRVQYSYDARGNLVEERLHPKPGDGEPSSHSGDMVRTAHYPATCTYRLICNRPEYVIDGRGHRTDFAYEATHGGVVSETGPADANGIRPQVRYTYEQRYAWIRNASGGYSQAATPVWVRTSERRCRTSAATGQVGTPCQTPNDESVTVFGYGPDSGPNNLLLRGTVVDPGGATLRTCFAYDANGNRLSETSARAGVSNCP